MRAHSAQQSVRIALNGATSVLETYKKAEENFKLSMEQRLNNLITEESDKQSQAASK